MCFYAHGQFLQGKRVSEMDFCQLYKTIHAICEVIKLMASAIRLSRGSYTKLDKHTCVQSNAKKQGVSWLQISAGHVLSHRESGCT